jgi:hypothetical protein
MGLVAAVEVLARLVVAMCLETIHRQGVQVLLLTQFGARQPAREKT